MKSEPEQSEPKWTKEPWRIYRESALDYRPFEITNGDSRIALMYGGGPTQAIGVVEEEANAKRIVATINACAGMTDPEREVAELRKMQAQWISVLDKMPPIDVLVLVCWHIHPQRSEVRTMALGERIAESWLSAYWCERPGQNALAHPYDKNGNPSAKDVSHWMPLPEAPEKPSPDANR